VLNSTKETGSIREECESRQRGELGELLIGVRLVLLFPPQVDVTVHGRCKREGEWVNNKEPCTPEPRPMLSIYSLLASPLPRPSAFCMCPEHMFWAAACREVHFRALWVGAAASFLLSQREWTFSSTKDKEVLTR
jgi:hypothetical protein